MIRQLNLCIYVCKIIKNSQSVDQYVNSTSSISGSVLNETTCTSTIKRGKAGCHTTACHTLMAKNFGHKNFGQYLRTKYFRTFFKVISDVSREISDEYRKAYKK